MAVDDLIANHREDILRICAKHGARNVRVFGSFARGDATPDSDLDLLVTVGPSRTAFFPGGLLADLQDLLSRKVDIVTQDALHWYIRERVLKEAIPL